VADLGLGLAGLAEDALYRADRSGRAEADRLVEDDPAVQQRPPLAGLKSEMRTPVAF